jgi:hypothetical protein
VCFVPVVPPTPIQLYTNSAATVTYVPSRGDPELGFVQVVWTAALPQVQDLQAVYMQVLHGLQHYQVRKALSDVRLRPPMPPAFCEWVTHYWIPRAILEADYSCVAVVTTKPAQDRLMPYYTPLTHRLQTRYFATLAAAQKWLYVPG